MYAYVIIRRFEVAQTSTGQRKLERFDLRNRRRIKEKQGEEEAESAVEPAGVMRGRMRRKMRKIKNLKFARNLTKFDEI